MLLLTLFLATVGRENKKIHVETGMRNIKKDGRGHTPLNFDEVNAKKREGGWEGFEKAAEKKEEEEVLGWKEKRKFQRSFSRKVSQGCFWSPFST